jgi:Virulence protein
MTKKKNLQIRNSTAEFLIFTNQSKESGIEVRVQDETVWLTQKAMAELFDVNVPAISKHLSNIFQERELDKNSVISILETTASDGKNYKTKFYNLDAIISVGYRINSKEQQHSVNGQQVFCAISLFGDIS